MLGSILALISAHRQTKSMDREAISQLDARLKEERKKATQMVNVLDVIFI